MVGKDNKGVFNPNFDAVDWSGEFCEGNSWHWSFCVFHDPQGLINLMGGKKEFNAMMDSVFVIPGKLGMESRKRRSQQGQLVKGFSVSCFYSLFIISRIQYWAFQGSLE